MSYSVGQVAGFAGVTVRTLHHYDEIGLLVPGERSRAGHRRYRDADLDRLQQILFYRELGFPLDEVAVLLDDPDADPRAHLRRQHELLTARIERLRKMAAAVEQAMEARRMGIDLTPEERFEVFGEKDPEQYAEEAEARWGGTEAYAESAPGVASYTKDGLDSRTRRPGQRPLRRPAPARCASRRDPASSAPAVMLLARGHRRTWTPTPSGEVRDVLRRISRRCAGDRRRAPDLRGDRRRPDRGAGRRPGPGRPASTRT
ncbi:HTH-type transcriptional activator TipA OS=Streptomyces fumanus OX=67302 GN=tipA PE=4 SV=1 [Streptomyces fumanus]